MSKQVIRLTEGGQVTIPKSIRHALGISSETPLGFRQMGSCIIIEPLRGLATLAKDSRQTAACPDVEPDDFSAGLEQLRQELITNS